MFCSGVCTYDKERTQAKDKADLLGAHAKVGLQVHRRGFEVHLFAYIPFLKFPGTVQGTFPAIPSQKKPKKVEKKEIASLRQFIRETDVSMCV